MSMTLKLWSGYYPWISSQQEDPLWEAKDSDEVIELLISKTEEAIRTRDEMPWEIDGLVIKVDELSKRPLLGETAHHPRWALAWKFPPEEATTVVVSVDWQTGRTGNSCSKSRSSNGLRCDCRKHNAP